MSAWTVPFSSSPPPSTPERRSNGYSHANGARIFGTNLSNTPAGPPPSYLKSFTPAGPPPSSAFASSEADYSHPFFNIVKSGSGSSSSSIPNSHLKKDRPRFKPSHTARDRARRHQPFVSSPPAGPGSDGDGTYETEDLEGREEDHEDRGYSEDSEQGSTFMDSDAENQPVGPMSTQNARANASVVVDRVQYGESLISDGSRRDHRKSRGRHIEKPHTTKEDSIIPVIAKNMASQVGIAILDDPDDLIVGTEDLVSQIYASSEGQGRTLESTLTTITNILINLWQQCTEHSSDESSKQRDFTVRVGPAEDAPLFHRAVFVATFLLRLRHPPAATGKQAFAVSRTNRPPHFQQKLTSTPKVLIDWLNDHHNPYKIATLNLMAHQPNVTASSAYWDLLFYTLVRGQISVVVDILKKSNFNAAYTSREDGQGQGGYQGAQLENVKMVIQEAIKLMGSCPGLQDGDWNVPGGEWRIFRKRVEQARDALTAFAEGHDRHLEPTESTFEAPNFGIKTHKTLFSETTRRAESKVPWTVYRNLKIMYGVLLGDSIEIISVAQDLVQATTTLTIWWGGDDDDDDDVALGSLAMSRHSFRRSQSRKKRLVDVDTQTAYIRRLAVAFERVTDDSYDNFFEVSPIHPIEVGLASIFEGNVEGVISLLRGWSLPVASAVVEIASQGGWYESSPGGPMTGFDESDLMVLSSYGQETQVNKRDSILKEYAEALFEKDVFRLEHQEPRDGWELSIGILTRLDDSRLMKRKFGELLQRIPLISDQRVDKILEICSSSSMEREAMSIAEKYADSITEDSDRYGTALIYYARAHRTKKVKDVLDLLVSLSLVQSIAFPPVSSLDQNLRAFLLFPKESLEQLAEHDREAAEILHLYLTGYATLRKFYDLRDEEVNLKEGEKLSLRPMARKKAAATALLAVINSAADNIHGGLYDPERGAVVQVDGLLALLGEATLFVDQPERILSVPQYFALLKAIEDLETVTQRVYSQCEECFRSTLASAQGALQAPPPRDLLRKTIRHMTSSSIFSLLGSSMLESESSIGGASGSSGVMLTEASLMNESGTKGFDGAKRGWDWRTTFKRDAAGKDILRMLRLGLARDISRAWVEEADCRR